MRFFETQLKLKTGNKQEGMPTPLSLHNAVLSGTLTRESVRLILDSGTDINERDDAGFTALHMAATNSEISCMNILLEANAFVDSRNTEGMTPFMLASYCASLEAVSVLLEAKADINAISYKGACALFGAIYGHKRDIVELLLENKVDLEYVTPIKGMPQNVFMYATINSVRNKNTEFLPLLVKHGVDINFANVDGRTAIMLVAGRNGGDVVNTLEMLIKLGADVEAFDKHGLTALMIAILQNNNKNIKVLRGRLSNKELARMRHVLLLGHESST